MEVFHKDSNQMTGHVWEPVADPSARQEVFVSFRGRKGAFSRNRKKVTASSPVEQRDAAWENIATWKFTSKIGLLRTFLGAKMRSVFFWHSCKLFLMSTKYTFLAKKRPSFDLKIPRISGNDAQLSPSRFRRTWPARVLPIWADLASAQAACGEIRKILSRFVAILWLRTLVQADQAVKEVSVWI